jgi:hypothetical protein
MRRNKIIKGFLLTLVAASAWQYGDWAYDRQAWTWSIAMSHEPRPYVYRVLIPWLAEILVWLGLQPYYALSLLIVLSAIGLLYAIKYLLRSVRS